MSKTMNKERAVESAMNQIERQFGKGAIMKLGSQPIQKVPVIPTGSLSLWTRPWELADYRGDG